MSNTVTTTPMQCLKALLQADFSAFKTRASLIISVALPIFLLVVWNNKNTIAAYGGPLFVIAIVMSTGMLSLSIMGYSVATARDRDKGVFQRLRVTPAPTWTIMLSRILIQQIANLVIALAVLIVGGHLYHVSVSVEDYILVLLIALLGGAVFLSIGQVIVGLVKSADSISSIGRFVYIAFLIFGLVGLSGSFGHTVETIAKWTPYGTVITVFAGIPHAGVWTGHNSLALLACFGYIIVFGFLGIRWFKWESR